jgi:hypothetical protein
MTAFSILVQNLGRRAAIIDAVAALFTFVLAFLFWLLFVSRISLIDYDPNDLLLLGSYGLIFFVGFVVAPLLLIAGRRRTTHYAQAIVVPIRWELDLWKKKKWLFGEYELRQIINENGDSIIKHNLSLIYRNLFLSLPAYAFHSVSTTFYYGERATQISILTAAVILGLLFDIIRRAKRIYVILSRQTVLYVARGPRSGPLSAADRWSSTEGHTLANQNGDLVVAENSSQFVDSEFDEFLDDETKDVLTRIRRRSPEEIARGLVKTGVFTEDGKLTKKYGGTH